MRAVEDGALALAILNLVEDCAWAVLPDLMSANKLPFGLILQEATVIPLLLIHRLLLLGYVFVVGHMSFG